MLFSRKLLLIGLLLVLGLSISACNISAKRNDDGTWTITGQSTEAEVSDVLRQAIDDPQVQNVAVDFHPGYVTASADFTNQSGTHVDTMTFRIDAGVKNGHLDLVISDVVWNGDPAQAERVAGWNQKLANGLERAGARNPNSTLISVTITDTDFTMVWNAEGRRGR